MLKNKDLIIRSPNSTRPWQHVLEPIFGYLRLARNYTLIKIKVILLHGTLAHQKKKNRKVIEIAKFTKKKFLNSKSKIIIKSYHLH